MKTIEADETINLLGAAVELILIVDHLTIIISKTKSIREC